MNQRKNIFSYLINAAIFIILEVAALVILVNNGDLQKLWINKGSHAFINYVWGKTEGIKYYFSLKSYNKELEEKNFQLEQRLRRLNYIANTPIDTKIDTIGNFTYTPAIITKLSHNKQHNFFIINKGAKDGIEPQSGIITDKGAIGIIESVSTNYSYAISFTNKITSISARINKDGPVGILKWTGESYSTGLLEGIPCHIPIEKGDSIFTSGYSDLFPPNIPLGISSGLDILNGATYLINVDLFENYKSLRSITIVKNIHKEEILELGDNTK